MPFHIVGYCTYSSLQSFNQTFVPRNKGFEIERAREVAEMFVGVHDFRSFMNVSREQRTVRDGAQPESFEFEN